MTDDPELTDKERIIAELVRLEQQLPGGNLIAADLRLAKAITIADQIFTDYDLPMREQLIAELTLWHCHLKDTLNLMHRSAQLLHTAITSASGNY